MVACLLPHRCAEGLQKELYLSEWLACHFQPSTYYICSVSQGSTAFDTAVTMSNAACFTSDALPIMLHLLPSSLLQRYNFELITVGKPAPATLMLLAPSKAAFATSNALQGYADINLSSYTKQRQTLFYSQSNNADVRQVYSGT